MAFRLSSKTGSGRGRCLHGSASAPCPSLHDMEVGLRDPDARRVPVDDRGTVTARVIGGA